METNKDKAQEKSNQHTIAAPSISLPKGGGAIRGMGEKFSANPVTGTGSMTVPIAVSPGRSGFGPQLSLSYDSGSGNGSFGFGWSLSLPSITRKTDKGLPQYRDAEESDEFILSGAEDLVPVLVKKDDKWEREVVPSRTVDGKVYIIQRFRPRIEGLFARIERWTNLADSTDTFWRSISKDNITTWYGKTKESRIFDPAEKSHIFSWLICQSYDDKGNVIVYDYKEETSGKIDKAKAHERNRTDQTRKANRYLKKIYYGNRVPYLPKLTENEWAQPPDPGPTSNPPDYFFAVVFDYDDGHYSEDKPDANGRIYAHPLYTPAPAVEWPVRVDPFSTYRAGFEVRFYRLCRRVLMFHHFPDELGTPDCLVRSTDFTYSYENDPTSSRNPIYSFLDSVSQSGYVRQLDETYLKKSSPPLQFNYSKPVIGDTIEAIDGKSLENLPVGLDGSTYQWTDLHGEGISGILTEQAGAWFYKHNLSPISKNPVEFAPLEQVTVKPNTSLAGGRTQFMDLAGDGQPDIVVMDGPMPGLYEHDEEEGWQPFRPFTSRLNRNMRDPNLKFVDLDGDGHADVLITEDDALVWHASLGEEGFGPAMRVAQERDEEKGPRLVFADGTQSIYLADLSGDGMSDLARIRNGEVCYWPNLGYGKFGAKVTMDNSPWFDNPDQFDHKYLRLADIDGSGTTDIIYLHRDGVRLYFNQSGNGWSAPQPLQAFPKIGEISAITPMDLKGNGTACLVWSSPLPGNAQAPMKYIDLMKEGKPHLLTRTVNNLGAETRATYAHSTKFYLKDKQEGKPWITRLPFPVHVVERVETYDHISRNRFVTRYEYHHGYFDGEEREFRGFGMVEQWDTEQFAALDDGNVPADNIAAASHVPPVFTKTWFHTGIFLGRKHVSDFFAGLLDANDIGEYYREPGLTDEQSRTLLLPDTIMPAGLTIEEEREACRALKGSMLRQEVYADDAEHPGATPEQVQRAHTPYTVTEQNFTIERLQPCGLNPHAVFFTHPREAISYHYERNPADPRIGHQMTLKVDDFGNVLKSVSVGYGRRKAIAILDDQNRIVKIANPGLNELTLSEQKKQTQLLITYTESDYTNIIDQNNTWRTPLPSEVRTYELTGLSPQDNLRFAWNEMAAVSFEQMTEIPYEANGSYAVRQKRIIERIRTLYYKDDQGGPLAVGWLDTLALPYETYKQAFNSGLLGAVFKNKANDQQIKTILESDGKYRDLESDGNWWIASGRQQFEKTRFYLPVKYLDPLGNSYTIAYDAFSLLMTETQDPLGNKVTAENDYRVLQPRMITDPNDNRSQAVFDALGMVAGTAVMGAENETVGDNLNGFTADPYQQDLDEFFNNPRGTKAGDLLQGATTRIIYDLESYVADGRPVYAATIAREKHVSDLEGNESKLQINFSYSDGFGREIQKKIQAESGLVPKRDGNGKIIVDARNQPVMTDQPALFRWVGSGWTIFNNKGKPVRQYEPFFTDTHKFEFAVRIGVSPILIYDPVDRVMVTLHPNHTYEKVTFDAWKQSTADVNDTVMENPAHDVEIKGFIEKINQADYRPTWYEIRMNDALSLSKWPDAENPQNTNIRKWEKQVAQKAKVHAGTPKVAYFDTQGRTFLTVEHNKYEQKKNGTTTIIEEKYKTNVELDIEGNQHWVTDALGRMVMKYDYDMLSTVIHQQSMEAGERWLLNNVAGKEIYRWNSRGFRIRTTYDELVRPLEIYLLDKDKPEIMVERLVYGEYHTDRSLKLRTRLYQHYDPSGVSTNSQYDFKGNLLEGRRQFAGAYKTYTNWIGLKDCHDINELKNRAASFLEGEEFTSSIRYDALNRPIQMVTPHTAAIKANIIQPRYNNANLLKAIDGWLRRSGAPDRLLDTGNADQHIVKNIDYNAKGQRAKIEYGNHTQTLYDYDFETFRLKNLHTTRDTNAANAEAMQDLWYAYDPTGNITHIQDDAQQTIYFNNQVVEPHSDYGYDAVYRLINATGREHVGQTNGAKNKPTQPADDDSFFTNAPHPHDGNAMDRYAEIYAYDAVGNILKMIHQAGQGSWTRNYAYNEPSLIQANNKSNRLSATSLPGDNENGPYRGRYTHDEHGNMTTMSHLPLMQWDYKDQLQASSQQVVTNGGKPETTWYVYEATGQRVRKITEAQAPANETPKRMKERLYLGAFEIYREYDTDGTTVIIERESLSVMDDKKRVALIETKTYETGLLNRLRNLVTSPKSLVRFQFDNHLGSACLELDEDAKVISYEEFFPYGNTSFQSIDNQREVPAKRYRYTGKERDEESGLDYYGARYYASWLGRWCRPDPQLIGALLPLGSQGSSSLRKNIKIEFDQKKSISASPAVNDNADKLRQTGKYASEDQLRRDTTEAELSCSSYSYVSNNPLIFLDPDGQAPIIFTGQMNIFRPIYLLDMTVPVFDIRDMPQFADVARDFVRQQGLEDIKRDTPVERVSDYYIFSTQLSMSGEGGSKVYIGHSGFPSQLGIEHPDAVKPIPGKMSTVEFATRAFARGGRPWFLMCFGGNAPIDTKGTTGSGPREFFIWQVDWLPEVKNDTKKFEMGIRTALNSGRIPYEYMTLSFRLTPDPPVTGLVPTPVPPRSVNQVTQ